MVGQMGIDDDDQTSNEEQKSPAANGTEMTSPSDTGDTGDFSAISPRSTWNINMEQEDENARLRNVIKSLKSEHKEKIIELENRISTLQMNHKMQRKQTEMTL